MAQPAIAVPGQTTTVYHQHPTPATPNYSQSYNGHSGRATGWIQLCCAVGMIMVGVAQFLLGSVIRFVAYGIWASLLCYGPAGILGIVSFRRRTALISAYIAMSILSAIVAFFMMMVGAIAAPISASQPCNVISCQAGLQEGRTTSDAMMGCIGLIEMVVAIVGSAFGCGGVCCDKPSPTAIQEITAVSQYVIAPTQQQSGSDVHTDQPPPYTAILQQQQHQQQQQNQNLIAQQQNPHLQQQQTYPPQQQTNSPQQIIVPQQQQTFPSQQILVPQQTQQHTLLPQQPYPQQPAYQPLIYPNSQGRQNPGFTVNQ